MRVGGGGGVVGGETGVVVAGGETGVVAGGETGVAVAGGETGVAVAGGETGVAVAGGETGVAGGVAVIALTVMVRLFERHVPSTDTAVIEQTPGTFGVT
jgi:hypothetical protein